MSIATRTTQTTWNGPLATGSGSFGKGSSGALDGLEVTWASRTEAPGGKTSPEELLAAAHSSCFSMALALCMGNHGTPPQTLEVTSTVTFDEVDGRPTITTSHIQVRAQATGLDKAQFAAIVDEGGELCPVSRLFAGAEITVEATLDES